MIRMAVGLEQLLKPVRESLGDDEVARRAVAATLQTIAERIGSDEARHLVPALPPEAAVWLFTEGRHRVSTRRSSSAGWRAARARHQRSRSGTRTLC